MTNALRAHAAAVRETAAAYGYGLSFQKADHGRWQYTLEWRGQGERRQHIGGGAEFATCLLAAELVLHNLRYKRGR